MIKSIADKEVLKKYIENDEYMSMIIEVFKQTQNTLHKATLKDFLTKETLIQYTKDILIDTDKQEEKSKCDNIFRTASVKTVNKKLDELEVLGLIEELIEGDYTITATDKLMKILDKPRVNKSVKSENELKIITEDKLLAARLRTIQELDEKSEKMQRYKYIYKLKDNVFFVGRKSDDTIENTKKRIDYIVAGLTTKDAYFKNGKVVLITDKDGMEFYKIIYKDEYKTLEKYLNTMCDTTRSSKKEIYKKQCEEYLDELQYQVRLGNYTTIKTDLKKEDLEAENISETQRIREVVTIYIHEDTRESICNYIERRLSGAGYEYKIIKYKFNTKLK